MRLGTRSAEPGPVRRVWPNDWPKEHLGECGKRAQEGAPDLRLQRKGSPAAQLLGSSQIQAIRHPTLDSILREAGLTLPVDYVRERRDLAGARREAFVELPTRRNRVWQMDFFELEASGGGTWRSGDVIDYATKLVLAGPVTVTQTTRDAIDSVAQALAAAEALLGRPLIDDLTDAATGEITPVFLVSDNGPCFKSAGFARYIDSRPELRHIRTRRRSPQTNGVIERYHGAIKIEALWRDLPADGAQMTTMVEDVRHLYNHIRPHETLAGARPIERYLADPDSTPTTTAPTRQTVRIP